jgi:Flp pilus assembly protein TadB
MNPLHIVLVISLIANAALGYAYLGQRDTATAAKTETKQSDGVAKACTEGVKTLRKQAAKRHADATPKVAAAAQQAEDAGKQAVQILTTPPAVPGNDCKSAQATVDAWWARKATK